MKTLQYIFLLALLILSICVQAIDRNALGNGLLLGKITDATTGEMLPGVNIYIPDLQVGTITDSNGSYRLNNIPTGKQLVQVSYVGYETIVFTLVVGIETHQDFSLSHSAREINEVVITGLAQAAEKNKTPTPIALISKQELLQSSSVNAIEAITKLPGLSSVTTGAAISKPIIRGLGYNRVVVVNDGIRQEGQQWGDEHGIEIDAYSLNRVEVIKGPASLAYGSDAMAGVINMISAPTLPDGTIAGSVMANYQTNNGLIGQSTNIAKNNNGYIWNLRLSNKMAHAYQNKYDGYVYNSGFREDAFSGIVGVNRSWGYSHLHFGAYHLKPGIVEGERDDVTGKFIKMVVLPDNSAGEAVATHSDMLSYTPKTPFQQIYHYKLALNSNISVGGGFLKTTVGYQQNRRQEFANVLEPNSYELYFLLNTINYDARYVFPEWNGVSITVGANGMSQTSQNKGPEVLVPEYNLLDIGGFSMLKRSFGKLDISGGIRFDSRHQRGEELFLDENEQPTSPFNPNATERFHAFTSTFSGVSGSIGATYQLSNRLYTKLNLSRGFRAPNIGELGSNGVHEGTLRYEMGDPNLKSETSLQFDYSLGYSSEHVAAEVNLFSNSVSNFIFLRKLTTSSGADSLHDGNTAFKFVSGDANLTGGEVTVDIHPHPLDWIHFQNSFSYVEGTLRNQPDSMHHLPFIPAPRFQSEVRFNGEKIGRLLHNAYVSFGVEILLAQDKFYAAYGTESRTPGYTLLNMGIGSDIRLGKRTICSVYITANNLADVAYQNHLSRLKYADTNNATGRTGVYNMGRNVDFKLVFPLNF
ncbi:TonB-dependent receptor [Williamwhitmania taraxaci]|uniref:Iron complex outermembrane recepter protein n=1 Tax=Williamwhitmania taraxaci TaxID=1640674 RepID=A0A1G6HFT0_9BACT|nr:TonB-dependent receptor [Williamwhitmania taraxaci]SDB93102.1 iron complex outermembrane recepter protein [Williamwhitmania taraxaci]